MLFGLPIEAISMIGSTILGGVMKMMGQAQQDRAEQWKQMMAQNKQAEQYVESARQYHNPNAAWIRRFIVILAMTGGLGIVFLAPAMDTVTNVPVQVTEGFKFWLFDFTTTVTKYVPLKGFVTPEWLPAAIMNIIGFYFGSAAVQRR